MTRLRSVVTIGNFDGVHAGHGALLARAHAIAEAQGHATRVVVMAFDPHPASVLAPERAPERLTTFEQRAELLGSAGADEVVRLEPTGDLLGLSARDFVAGVVNDLHPVAVVEGEDFRFGRGREGGLETLRELGGEGGFTVDVAPTVEVALTDGTLVRASSTTARWLIGNGRMLDAAAVLGRAYEMVGIVVRGDQRGRQIGFPTANLDSACMAPADGVYGGRATLPDGREMIAAISVGTKPTFGEAARTVEAFLMAPETANHRAATVADDSRAHWAPLPGLHEYGWPLRLSIAHWIRDQVRFDSLGELLEQMGRDCQRIRELAGQKEAACR